MDTIAPALEKEYNNRQLVPEHPAIFERWRTASAAFRAGADGEIDIAYGRDERHRLDLFRAPDARGTVVFIHGGYWRSLDKGDFSFVAAPFMARGLSVAAFNYRLCPTVQVADIVADCRAALQWLLANGPVHGMPVDRLALSGHSAGGHLVAMLFATDWQAQGIDMGCVIGGVALSAVSNLAPLIRCSMNQELQLNAVTAPLASPIHHRCRLAAPLHLAVGADESSAFLEQTRQLQRAWPANCPAVNEVAGCNHFTIVDDFARGDSASFQFITALFT